MINNEEEKQLATTPLMKELPYKPDLTIKFEGSKQMAIIEVYRKDTKGEMIKRIMKYPRLNRANCRVVVIVCFNATFTDIQKFVMFKPGQQPILHFR